MADLRDKIVVMGDIHGDFATLNTFINKHHPKIILQVGDFGYWPNMTDVGTPKAQDTLIYFCDGNHEDHWALRDRTTDELWPNIHFMPRGSTLRLPDGRNVLFIGGGISIDKYRRTIGVSWFPEETITQKDISNLPDETVDIVISHTCPNEFDIRGRFNMAKFDDPSQDALSVVLEKYNPALWYFGHFHVTSKGTYNKTKWQCVDMTYNQQWWTILDDVTT